MKLDRFDLTVWGLLGVLGLALFAVIVGSPLMEARVTRTFPANAGEVDASGRIGLEFAELMQAQTVEPLLTLEPATAGQWQWEGRQLWFTPAKPFQPGVMYTARLAAGALSQSGRTMNLEVTWTFRARPPWIVYVSPVVEEPRQLWRIPSTGGQAQRLTSAVNSVQDFAVSPSNGQIVYSQKNAQQGFDLWLMTGEGADQRLVVDCGPSLCVHPAWSPDGTQIAFNRHAAGLHAGELGPPRVWLIDIDTGQSQPLYDDPQIISSSPSWSPDGRRIATQGWLSPDIRVLDLQTRTETRLASRLYVVGQWSPDGNQMLFRDLVIENEQSLTTLQRVDFRTQLTQTVSREAPSRGPTTPVWSPSGEWVVFGRRLGDGSLGKQLWLSRPDGTDERAVTHDPGFTLDAFAWDPWGQAIVLQRFELNVPNATPDVAVWTMATGELKVLAKNASQPAWQP